MRLIAKVGKRAVDYKLRPGELSVGSGPDNDLVIDDPSVSRNHATVRRRFGRFVVRDLNSTNGTFVNELRVSPTRRIRPQDKLRFGAVNFEVARNKTFHLVGVLAVVLVGFLVSFVAIRLAVTRSDVGKGSPEASPPAVVGEVAPGPAGKTSVATIEPPPAPSSAPAASTGSSSIGAEFTPHDLTSMAYLLCTVRIDQQGYFGGSEPQRLYEEARRIAGPEGKLADERAVRADQDPVAYFSYDPNPADSENAEREHFIDWLARLKHKVESDYADYTPVMGATIIEPRSPLIFETVGTLPVTPGARYRWMGKWDQNTPYQAGDLVAGGYSAVSVAAKSNIDVTPGQNARLSHGYQPFPGTWQPFQPEYLCSALSDELTEKIGDHEPIGNYASSLARIKQEKKLANDINKLGE
jgi:hypothetical protein